MVPLPAVVLHHHHRPVSAEAGRQMRSLQRLKSGFTAGCRKPVASRWRARRWKAWCPPRRCIPRVHR